MKIYPERLAAQLKDGLAPVYLLAGDEPLLIGEAADAVRTAARTAGYTDREVYHVERGFDWNGFTAAGDSLSLFASRRLIELRMENAKPDATGTAALCAYAERPAQDTVLLVITDKLDKGARNARWVKALDSAGVFVQVWPLDNTRLPVWLEQRMRSRGLRPTREAVQLLAERVEGNLLAAAQEIDKLVLLCGAGELDGSAVRAAVTDSARYDVFKFVDTALAGERGRAIRALDGLRGEGVEPTLLLWALTREIRSLAGMAAELEHGRSLSQATASVWEKRRPLVRRALERLPAQGWRHLLILAARTDRIIKGREAGDPWHELLKLTAGVVGLPTLETEMPRARRA